MESNKDNLDQIKSEKKRLLAVLNSLDFVEEILPTVTNFITFSTPLADELYLAMKEKNMIIRRMSSVTNGIRITVGTEKEMTILISYLKTFEKEKTNA